jgi:conjugative relaxase-like TrwC/TraI family protein
VTARATATQVADDHRRDGGRRGRDNGRYTAAGTTCSGVATGELTEPDGAVFRELLAGRLEGEPLAAPVWRYPDGPGGRRVDARRGGFDATFSAAKSVSVLLALGGPEVREQVRQAHAAAVGDALGLLEQLAGRAAGGHHGDAQRATRIATSGLIAAAFEHSTSRAAGPQLHTRYVGLSRGTHANHLFLLVGDNTPGDEPCQPTAGWRRPAGPGPTGLRR